MSASAWRVLERIRFEQDQASGRPPVAADLLGTSAALWGTLHGLTDRGFVVIRGRQLGITRAGRSALTFRS